MLSRLFIALYILGVTVLLVASEQRSVVAQSAMPQEKEVTSIEVASIPEGLQKRHQAFPGCIDISDPVMPEEGLYLHARLDANTELFGILCEPDVYNMPYAVYIVPEGYYEDAERAYFAEYSNETGWIGADVLYNPTFDQKQGILAGFSKARGTGDCGSKQALKWNGERLTLIEYRYKAECDENLDKPFPLIYKRHLQP